MGFVFALLSIFGGAGIAGGLASSGGRRSVVEPEEPQQEPVAPLAEPAEPAELLAEPAVREEITPLQRVVALLDREALRNVRDAQVLQQAPETPAVVPSRPVETPPQEPPHVGPVEAPVVVAPPVVTAPQQEAPRAEADDADNDEMPREEGSSGPCAKTGNAVCQCGSKEEDEAQDDHAGHETPVLVTRPVAEAAQQETPHADHEDTSDDDEAGASGTCPKTGDAVCLCGTKQEDEAQDDHAGHEMPTVATPATEASQAEIDAFVDAVRAQPEAHAHGDDMGKMSEHMAAMDLVPRDEATHIAVSDGDWFDKNTWHNGNIPDDNAKVLIPEGINVQYGSVSDVRLFTVRVDGELDFATDMDSRIIFDTMVVSPTGSLVIGSEVDPVDPNVSVELIVANNGPIDVDWDPMLLSRGLIAHGETSIHGAAKDSHDKVLEDPMAGDKFVSFDEVPEGWQIGDTIVVAGTSYEGHKWDNDLRTTRAYESEDEVRVITKIEDGRVYFEEALEHDHDTPRADLKTSVANYTRNVSIETENGAEAEIYERGHVMFMHSNDVEVRYAEFHELGRTDKSELSKQHDDFDEPAFDNNVQGRYSLHLHRTGVETDNDPAIVEGNAVWGSPGWGVVHHDSFAVLENNATFDTFGAGYVAETGNETGAWNDNIAIYAQGISWGSAKVTSELSDDLFDTARAGDGFYFQGRLVETNDNVAASVNHGFSYFHRNGDDRQLPIDADQFEYSDAFYGRDDIGTSKAPILDFSGNETFAANQGLAVVKGGTPQNHDIWSHIDDFTAWNVKTGVFLEYTTHYLLTDIDVIGKDPTQYSPAREGIELGKGTGDIVIADSKVDNFTNGILLDNGSFPKVLPAEYATYTVIDTEITNTDTDYPNFDPALNTITTRAALDSQAPDLDLQPLIFTGKYVEITGTKHDGLGDTDFPSGIDEIKLDKTDVQRHLEEDGYWTTSDGQDYFLLDVYFSDRLTGDVYYETHNVALTEQTTRGFGKWWSDYENAKPNGVQDIVTQNGETRAGDIVLGKPLQAVPYSAQQQEAQLDSATLWNALTDGQGVRDDTPPVEVEEELEEFQEVAA